MSKLYTRTGDDGSTGLFGGDRVSKDHARVEAYGTVDELNACLGLVVSACAGPGPNPGPNPGSSPGPVVARLRTIFAELQSRLFDLGADLATPEASRHESKIVRISGADVAAVEGWIDEIDGGNAPMKSFVLPGGTELAARLHLARTVARRAERSMVALAGAEAVNPRALVYMNRVSDMLFACARAANREARLPDVPWHSNA